MTAQAGKREAMRAMGWRRGRLVPFGVAGVAVHLAVVRPRQQTWGSTVAEVARPLPGDDLVASPTFTATRAISVAAPPERIWPWLVQVGVGRAGWYSYDLLDNLGRPSARRVVPEFQDLAPGDVVPMSPDGRQGLRVHAMDPPRSMVWGTPGDTTWAWWLEPRPDGTTRVLTRIRSRVRPSPMSIAFSVLLEVADFWMIRKMLLNLRDRAEGRVGADRIPLALPHEQAAPDGAVR